MFDATWANTYGVSGVAVLEWIRPVLSFAVWLGVGLALFSIVSALFGGGGEDGGVSGAIAAGGRVRSPRGKRSKGDKRVVGEMSGAKHASEWRAEKGRWVS